MGRRRLAKWYKVANVRRAELIHKERTIGLARKEKAELEELQRRCLEENYERKRP